MFFVYFIWFATDYAFCLVLFYGGEVMGFWEYLDRNPGWVSVYMIMICLCSVEVAKVDNVYSCETFNEVKNENNK